MISNTNVVKALTKGYFAVNKPKNLTSVDVLEKLKSILLEDLPIKLLPKYLKLGHGGTLDHTATGVLAIGVGWGCKILPLFLHGDKRYKVTGCFGKATDTYNESGNIIQENKYDHITKEMFEETLKNYIGIIKQIPPNYSALKLHGRRVADWTREGKNIQMSPRKVVCYSIHCNRFNLPHFQIDVSCGGGFYIRSLIHDLGQDLLSCAHVTELHRTKHGLFTEEDALHQKYWNGNEIVKAIDLSRKKYDGMLKRSKVE